MTSTRIVGHASRWQLILIGRCYRYRPDNKGWPQEEETWSTGPGKAESRSKWPMAIKRRVFQTQSEHASLWLPESMNFRHSKLLEFKWNVDDSHREGNLGAFRGFPLNGNVFFRRQLAGRLNFVRFWRRRRTEIRLLLLVKWRIVIHGFKTQVGREVDDGMPTKLEPWRNTWIHFSSSCCS